MSQTQTCLPSLSFMTGKSFGMSGIVSDSSIEFSPGCTSGSDCPMICWASARVHFAVKSVKGS